MQIMFPCFSTEKDITLIPIIGVTPENYERWLTQQTPVLQKQLLASTFEVKSGHYFLCFDTNGNLSQVIVGMENERDFWAFGNLSANLPDNHYQIGFEMDEEFSYLAYLAWGLGSYQYTKYKTMKTLGAKLVIAEGVDTKQFIPLIKSIFWIRDLINTPTQDMGPSHIASEAESLAKRFSASIYITQGDELQTEYPCVYTVGKGSDHEPCLIDLRWGNPEHPKVTLVGKGVCFDSGGYDLKPADGMLAMKKDMGGAAHALGLAKLVMAYHLPICLRVLIPVVENLVSGKAYLPGDVIKSRKGTTIEINNTDAEGRLILADALFEASSEKPDLLIDFATLTGAATVALGGEVAAFFTNYQPLADDLMKHSKAIQDPIWQLPLYAPYRTLLKSNIADLSNVALGNRGGGAITAALFLQNFIDPSVTWVHFDLMASNRDSRAGRPEGGEATTLRAMFAYLKQKYLPKD